MDRGRKLVMQIHYNVVTSGLSASTRTRVELEFDDGPCDSSALAGWVASVQAATKTQSPLDLKYISRET